MELRFCRDAVQQLRMACKHHARTFFISAKIFYGGIKTQIVFFFITRFQLFLKLKFL